MKLGKMFGKLAAAPVRLVAAPLHAVDVVVAKATGDRTERVLGRDLEAVAKVIEETTEEVADGLGGDS